MKYNNRYRIDTTRLPSWDYGANAPYFVTICTKNREKFFGKIINNSVRLSPIGKIAQKYWLEIPKHFPFVKLDKFIIMPNHIHGIIIINKNVETQYFVSPKNTNDPNVETQNIAGTNVETQNIAGTNVETQNIAGTNVETQNIASLQKNKFGPQSQNLASIVRGFKSGVKSYTTKNNLEFAWQPRYYDHIIRDYESLERIRKYIQLNPNRWLDDEYQL